MLHELVSIWPFPVAAMTGFVLMFVTWRKEALSQLWQGHQQRNSTAIGTGAGVAVAIVVLIGNGALAGESVWRILDIVAFRVGLLSLIAAFIGGGFGGILSEKQWQRKNRKSAS